ncbi:hypothetical protein [Streptomyces scabiei]|uniref:hypothetical protein n=1 Tax=Streptomyces scabiei TaxID=1930 RepID=UPI002FF3B191
MPPIRMASGATPAITVSGAAAETTKKAMSVVPSEPERRDGAGESSPPAAGAAVASAVVASGVTVMGKALLLRAGAGWGP